MTRVVAAVVISHGAAAARDLHRSLPALQAQVDDVVVVANTPASVGSVPEGVRVLNDPNQAVVTVAPPAAEEAVVATAATTEVAAAAEPEVLTERKPKEEAAAEAFNAAYAAYRDARIDV